jgi:hypothetical protein
MQEDICQWYDDDDAWEVVIEGFFFLFVCIFLKGWVHRFSFRVLSSSML